MAAGIRGRSRNDSGASLFFAEYVPSSLIGALVIASYAISRYPFLFRVVGFDGCHDPTGLTSRAINQNA